MGFIKGAIEAKIISICVHPLFSKFTAPMRVIPGAKEEGRKDFNGWKEVSACACAKNTLNLWFWSCDCGDHSLMMSNILAVALPSC